MEGASYYEARRIRLIKDLADTDMTLVCEWVDKEVEGYLRKVDGRLRTLMEAISTDKEQCEARKDMIRDALWEGSEALRFNLLAYIVAPQTHTDGVASIEEE